MLNWPGVLPGRVLVKLKPPEADRCPSPHEVAGGRRRKISTDQLELVRRAQLR